MRPIAYQEVYLKRIKHQALNGDMPGFKSIFCKELGEHRHFKCFIYKPWEKGLGKVSVFPALGGISGEDDNVDTIKKAT